MHVINRVSTTNPLFFMLLPPPISLSFVVVFYHCPGASVSVQVIVASCSPSLAVPAGIASVTLSFNSASSLGNQRVIHVPIPVFSAADTTSAASPPAFKIISPDGEGGVKLLFGDITDPFVKVSMEPSKVGVFSVLENSVACA